MVLSGWVACGQRLTPEQLTGTWLGVHLTYDTAFYCPLPTYLQLNADGTGTIGLIDEAVPPQPMTWTVTDDRLQLDTNRYARGQVTLLNDRLRINGLVPLEFRRYVEAPVDVAQARDVLTNNVWTVDSLDGGLRRLHLHDNRQACIENPATGHQTLHHWALVPHGRSVLLILKGNPVDSTGRYRAVLQLTALTNGQFSATGWNGRSVTNQTVRAANRLSPGAVCQPIGFQTCNSCLYRPLSMYYSFDRKGHSERLWYVRDTYRRHYQPVALPGQSGLVRIRFVVNCAGDAGQFDVLEVDAQYQKRPFDQRITGQFTAGGP